MIESHIYWSKVGGLIGAFMGAVIALLFLDVSWALPTALICGSFCGVLAWVIKK